MDTDKLIHKLEDYFNLSKKKQETKRNKLSKIIEKLERKKAKLETKVVDESKIDETSSRYHDLSQELKVISRLIIKAKKQALSN